MAKIDSLALSAYHKQGTGGGIVGVTKEYVDDGDAKTLADAKVYTDLETNVLATDLQAETTRAISQETDIANRTTALEQEINNLTYSSTDTSDLGYIQDFIRDNTADYTSKTFLIRQAKFQSAPIASSSNTVTIQVARAGSGYTSALYIDIDAGRSFIGYNKNISNQAFTWKEIGV